MAYNKIQPVSAYQMDGKLYKTKEDARKELVARIVKKIIGNYFDDGDIDQYTLECICADIFANYSKIKEAMEQE